MSRKAEHVELCLDEDVEFAVVTSGFERYRFRHNALPEMAVSDADTRTALLGHPLAAPLIVASMTGGYADAERINRELASAAQQYGLAMGVGSARQALHSSEHHGSYRTVREVAPGAFLFTNIGAFEAAELYRKGNVGELNRVIDLIEANAIAIHLNPLQELLQPEGSPDFRDVLAAIEACARELPVPIIVKEVGAGISGTVARRLVDVGVKAIDVAGAGGTSWAAVEILRSSTGHRNRNEVFREWGIPTATAIQESNALADRARFTLIGSGGIRTGVDVAMALALGADLASIARPLLQSLEAGGAAGLHKAIDDVLFQLRAVMFLTGSKSIDELKAQELISAQSR